MAMPVQHPSQHQINLALNRVLESLTHQYAGDVSAKLWLQFTKHFKTTFPTLFESLYPLYAHHWDFYFHLEQCTAQAAHYWMNNHNVNTDSASHDWFESSQCIGATGYVDLFAGTISGLESQVGYLKELGISYLHLMPLFDVPAGDSDGGYAIKDFGKVNPALGSLKDLKAAKKVLQKNDIKLVLDFVFNHISDEHEWAIQAKAGNPTYQDFFWLFSRPEDKAPYATHLRDIFPDKRQGCFTYSPELDAEVWTTFNSFQWDLNYSNPNVFCAMSGELLKVVDAGADVIRLDALAFVWKEPGTSCENLPKAHTLIQAFNAFLAMAAPAVIFKSEAIVEPDKVLEYIAPNECPLSYNPNLMALLWESLATRQTQLLIEGTQQRAELPNHTRWVNYLRCHDDIGWAFSDQDAWSRGINPYDHRQFLNRFYTGEFDGSFAKGVPFQYNPETGDCRISGTLASLVGLDSHSKGGHIGVQRAILLHGILMAFKGIPLIYLGDELATLNDMGYTEDPEKANDSRWVHRIAYKESVAQRRYQENTLEQIIFTTVQQQIKVRSSHKVFGSGSIHIFPLVHEHLYAFRRELEAVVVTVLANLSEHKIYLTTDQLSELDLHQTHINLLNNELMTTTDSMFLNPYDIYWLTPEF